MWAFLGCQTTQKLSACESHWELFLAILEAVLIVSTTSPFASKISVQVHRSTGPLLPILLQCPPSVPDTQEHRICPPSTCPVAQQEGELQTWSRQNQCTRKGTVFRLLNGEQAEVLLGGS